MYEVNGIHSSGTLFFAEFFDLVERESHFKCGTRLLGNDPLLGFALEIFIRKSGIVGHGRFLLPPG